MKRHLCVPPFNYQTTEITDPKNGVSRSLMLAGGGGGGEGEEGWSSGARQKRSLPPGEELASRDGLHSLASYQGTLQTRPELTQ